jgi:flavin reductase (DIM6/NTAB) family NADH-FMN oxidoreductase RutF
MAGAGRAAMTLLDKLLGGVYVLTAAHESRRSGQVVRWVMPCAEEPPLVCVAVRKGHAVEPLIRDSGRFAVCRLDPRDKALTRRFSPGRPPDSRTDPFEGLEVCRLQTGAPVLLRSVVALDCELVRHFDAESDHDLYIGLVVGGGVRPAGA